MRLARIVFGGLILGLSAFSSPQAQYYFGQNKIQYTSFDWQVLTTEHFNIYFYPEEKEIAETAAKLAEDSYSYLQEKFNHTVDKKIPFIVYSSPVFFEQTNIIPGLLPENVAGFTEFFKQRVVIPFNGSFADFSHVVRHEIVHVFMMEKISYVARMHRRNNPAAPPLWFTEGIAEYWSEGWDSEADMFIRDMAMSGRIISMDNIYSISGTFLMYKVGQSILNYLGETYGDEMLAELFDNWWKGNSFSKIIEITYGKSLKELGAEWEYWLRKRYYPYIQEQELPDRVADVLTRDGYNIKPTIFLKDTKEGRKEYIAFKTFRMGYSSIAVMPLDGESLHYKTLVKGGRSEQYESLHFTDSGLDASIDGLLAFASKTQESDALYIFDTKRQKAVGKFKFPSLIAISSPAWSPDGAKIVFEGITKSGRSDLYLYDMHSEELTQLTDDIYVDQTPSFSYTDDLIAFSSDRSMDGAQGARNLYLYHLENGRISRLTFGNHVDESPRFTRSGDRIIFASDRGGTMNLYIVDGVTNGHLNAIQLTNFVTGAFDPILANYDSTVVFSAYQNFKSHIYKMKLPDEPVAGERHPGLKFPSLASSETWSFPKLEGELSRGSARYKTHLSFDIAQSAVAYDPIVGTMGGLQFALTDILGNHQYYFLLYNTANTREDFLKSINFGVTYLNKTRRFNYGGGIFHFYDEYSEDYYGYVAERTYGGFLAGSYPISRYRRFDTGLFLRRIEKDTFYPSSPKATTAMWSIFYVKDTSIWDPTGPIEGTRFNIGMSQSLDLSDLKYYNSTYNIDFRKYFRLAKASAYATRLIFRHSVGKDPQRYYLGGSWSLRGYPRRFLYGKNLLLVNNELRFPLVNDLLIGFPFGNLRFQAIRGAIFFDLGNAWDDKFSTIKRGDTDYSGLIGSFGFGFRVSLGYVTVLRFDFARKTDFKSVNNKYDFDFFFGWNF
jgi:Tol biopolymer transport system component